MPLHDPTSSRSLTDLSSRVADKLRRANKRVFVIESTTGGLISAALQAQPGSSRFYTGGLIVYSGTAYKRLIPPNVLKEAGVLDVKVNYSGAASYVASKERFVRVVGEDACARYKSDYCLVESGTTGPEFYVPGVDRPFTAIGATSAAPVVSAAAASAVADATTTATKTSTVVVVEVPSCTPREAAMWTFAERALLLLEKAIDFDDATHKSRL
jgi:nicotinamide mononucleotide (NMN) deamidase PncC